eukprot:Gb_09428 [translate_table: standard]
MAENFYRPIPQRSSFRAFSELLSETNEEANEEFQCLNDDIISQQSPESVPCTLFDSEMQSVNIMQWEHIQPDYKKINDYERNIPSGHDSYWQMTSVDRTLKKLPSKYNEDIFQAMENNFGQDRIINSGNLVEDTSATDFGAFEDQLDPASHGIGILEESNDINDDISVEGNKQSTGKKRKSISKMSGVKATLIESNKMIMHSLDMVEEACTKHHESTEAVRRRYKRKELDSRHNIDNKNRQVLEGTFRPGIEFDQLHTEDSVPKSHDGKITRAAYEDVVINIMKVDRVIEIKVPHQKKGQCELVLVGA